MQTVTQTTPWAMNSNNPHGFQKVGVFNQLTITHGFRQRTVCVRPPCTNVSTQRTVCDIHTNGNVFLGFTVWDVHTNGNDWVSMPRPIAHGPCLCPRRAYPRRLLGRVGTTPLSPTLTWRWFQMPSRKGVKNRLFRTDAHQW